MNIQEFCDARPYLYHLTDRTNLPIILSSKTLLSTMEIASISLSEKKAKDFLRKKRETHITLDANGATYNIRDQKPILMKVLSRSLSDGDAGDFIELLNKRVFWWPTLDRLTRHYNRYESEKPVILRVRTLDMLQLNKNVEFCHLNSGATRCHPSYGGNAPTRGIDTFLGAQQYYRAVSSIAEVTFVQHCKLPLLLWTGTSPKGDWTKI